MRKKGSVVLESILLLAILAAVYFLMTGGFTPIWKFMAQGLYTDLNPLVAAREELPVGEWGRISVRFVVGEFASDADASYGFQFDSDRGHYYIAVLNSFQIIVIKASDEAEHERLQKMCDDPWDYGNLSSLTGGQEFAGKIEKLSNWDLKQYYDKTLSYIEEELSEQGMANLRKIMNAQYIILDTGAIPPRSILRCVGVGVLAIIAGIVMVRMRKKSMLRAALTEGKQTVVPGKADFQAPYENKAE